MKKLILPIAVLLLALALTGCAAGNNSSDQNATAAPTQATADTTASQAPEEERTLAPGETAAPTPTPAVTQDTSKIDQQLKDMEDLLNNMDDVTEGDLSVPQS